MKAKILFTAILLATLAAPAWAKPKEKKFDYPARAVFRAALSAARTHHVVTYVDEKHMLFTFETGTSATSYGFVCNASVEAASERKSRLVLNVQKKNGRWGVSFAWGAGDRLAKKFFGQVGEELKKEATPKKSSS
jgi:hypothetical protein